MEIANALAEHTDEKINIYWLWS